MVIYRNEVFTSLHVYIWRARKSDWLNYACFEQQWLFFSVFSCWCFAQVATLHNGRFPFNRKIRNFWKKRTIQPKIPEIPVRKSMEREFPGTFFEDFGTPQEVVLFMGKVCKLTTFYSAEVFFWPRSQRARYPSQRWRLRVFDNGVLFFFNLATAKFVEKVFNTNKNNASWCSCLICIGWRRNVQRFITRAELLYHLPKH